MKNKRVLLTGYGAFHTYSENPSEKLTELFSRESIPEWEIETKVLPVVFDDIPEVLSELNLRSYDVVLFTGLAASRDIITPEKVALNWLYSPDRADNSGELVKEGKPLIPELPLATMTTFPVEQLTEFLNQEGLESKVSFSAGTYVCNTTFFYGLNQCFGENLCTFLHIPEDVDVKKLSKALGSFLAVL